MYVPSDVRDFAIFVSELNVDPKDMLLSCIKHMSKHDVKDMLISEGYTSEKEMEILRVDVNARQKAFS
tara:strand:+ start:107 stop:310 length:204 start_codon:yes stop_codon:yes gene_type:complete